MVRRAGRLGLGLWVAAVLALAQARAAETSLPFQLVGNRIVVTLGSGAAGGQAFLFDPFALELIDAARAASLRLAAGPDGLVALPGPVLGRGAGLRFAVADLSPLIRDLGLPVLGVLGAGLSGHAVLRIDYASGRITLIDPRHFTPPAGFQPVFTLPGSGGSVVAASLDHVPIALTLAPGYGGAVRLRPGLAAEHGFAAGGPMAVTGFAADGPVWSRIGRGHTLVVGGITLPAPLLEVPARSPPELGADAVLGGAELKRFTLILDRPGRRIWLRANALTPRPPGFDRSGLWVDAGPDGYPVVVVVGPATPAARAGLVEGDRILAVNGRSLRNRSVGGLRAALARPGKRLLRLRVAAGKAKPRLVALTLADRV